jgi:hypothetical protein
MASSFLSDCGSGEKFRDQTYPLFARYLKGKVLTQRTRNAWSWQFSLKTDAISWRAGNF